MIVASPPLSRVLEYATRAVLVVDMVESVRLIEQDERGTVERWLGFVDRIEAQVLPASAGHLVKRLGDGFLAEFPFVQAAASAAFAIQHESNRENLGRPAEQQMLLRMGIEIADIIVEKDDVYGRGVNRAARLVTLAGPGEIVVSANVRDQLTPVLDADVEDLGECYLKHVEQPVRAYRIGPPGPRPVIEPGAFLGDLRPSLAVIPFTTRSGAGAQDVLGEVLAEETIRELSRSPELNVISRLSTTVFRGRGSTLAEISANLSADYVLSGEYRVENRRVVIDAELAEAKSGRIVWTKRHKGQVSGILSGRRDLVDQIVRDVGAAVMTRELERAQSQALPTLKSYTLLIGAVALMHRLSFDDFMRARRLLETLTDRATRHPIPQAWLAKWHVLRVQQGWSTNRQEDARLALHCTKQALEADSECSPALVAGGFVYTNLFKQLDVAQDHYSRAIRSNPNDGLAWLLKGTLHAFTDDPQQAVNCTQRALRLSPLDPHRYFYDSLAATAYLAAHQFERAMKHAQRSLRANRTHTSTLRALAVAQWHLGFQDDARSTARELLILEPDLTVSRWLDRSPSASYSIGKEWAETFRQIGLPN